ncbi:coiled-coil domain-containing protein 22 isoform X1 [Pectinophora gossypiella]|uniref:coiled-coil domain-containing protein 22 isoform X1 n=1 Tax=Pectinophora gossypiella TaxID=13191 RepID=UPI00214E5BD2|nr:coiled-coil domain-containing protein 22 isoform X1 [Pectinophora gossypiella]
MEEVDSIILHFLRQLNIDISDEIKSICELPVETITEATSKCLITINPSLKVPTKLPSGISHRIEVAAQIASICKDLGYKNDVGYQTFLYYNEAELRQVFMFLIERLPSEGKHTTVKKEPTNKKSLLMQNISSKIAEELNSIWIPPCCGQPYIKTAGDFKDPKDFNLHTVNTIGLTDEEIIQKLQKIKDVKTSSSLQSTTDGEKVMVNDDQPTAVEDVKIEINKSLKELKETAIILRQKLDTLESERNVMEVEYSQAQKSCERAEADLMNVQNILNSIGITEFESGENILDKVQGSINLLHRKSEELTSRNLSLKVDIDKLKNSLSLTESERTKCKKILINLKENAKSMKEEYEKKEEMRDQLKSNYDKMKGGNKRSIYTKRIMEIISNVDKQNLEIQKILEDTRQLQKEINTLEGQLDRCFSIADETLFKDAKKDDQAKKAYKLLALLHSECNTIVSLVNDTGTLARDIVDLEDNIKAETAKRTEDTLKRVQVDLAQMLKESNHV